MGLFDRRAELKTEIEDLTKQVGELNGSIVKLTREHAAAAEAVALSDQVLKLKRQVADLEIEKSKKTEEFDKRERELTHMVGLERSRQEQEIKLAKRETTVEVREGNLKAEREEFEKRMAFREKTFDEQTKSMKSILEQVLGRLPTVTVGQTHEIHETVGAKRR